MNPRPHLLLLLLILSLCGLPAAAATFKIATLAPDGTSWMKGMRTAATQIEQRTAGRVRFVFYPGGIMGNDKSVLRKIRIGQLQGGAVTGGGLAEIYSDAQLYSLPLTFRSLAEVDYVRSRMDATLMAGLRENGFVSFGLTEGGFAYLMSDHPLRRVEDLKARKVWIPEGDRIGRAAFEALGVSPISLPLTDVLTGLQSGLVDTVATSPIGAIALQWHTRVKYLADTPLIYLYATLVLERRAFERLSATDQGVVHEVLERLFRDLDHQNRRDNEGARTALQGQQIEFIQPEAQASWQASAEAVVERMTAEGVLSAPLVKALRGHLATFRATLPHDRP